MSWGAWVRTLEHVRPQPQVRTFTCVCMHVHPWFEPTRSSNASITWGARTHTSRNGGPLVKSGPLASTCRRPRITGDKCWPLLPGRLIPLPRRALLLPVGTHLPSFGISRLFATHRRGVERTTTGRDRSVAGEALAGGGTLSACHAAHPRDGR